MTRPGVLAALWSEARCFGTRAPRPGVTGGIFELGDGVLLCVSGVGAEAARAGAQALLERGADALASFGTAGGLDPGLAAGALVLPEQLVAEDGSFASDPGWRAALAERLGDLPFVQAPLADSARVVKSREQKADLRRASGAAAVDMESAALARVAGAAGVPFLAVRAVCDTADTALPSTALSAVDSLGRVRVARLLRGLLAHPGQARDLWGLHHGFRAAERTLRTVVARGGPDLAAAVL